VTSVAILKYLPERSWASRYGIAALAVLAAAILRVALDPLLGQRGPLILFTLAIFVAARFGGRNAGLAATLTSALAGWYFLIAPRFSFKVEDLTDSVKLIVLVVVGVVTSFVIGHLRQSLDETANTREYLRLFVEHCPVPIAMLTREMTYVAASRSWSALHRLGEEDLAGRSHFEVLPQTPETWRQVYKRCLAGAVERSERDAVRGRDGGEEWFRWEVRPWRDSGGAIGGIIIFLEQVTDRVVLEEQLRRRAEELQKLMDVAPVGIWVAHDAGCHHITGNPMANALFEGEAGENLAADPPPGAPVPTRRFFRDGRELAPSELPMLVASTLGQEVRYSETDVRLPGGKRLALLGSATPLRDAGGQIRGCVGVFQDITDRKQAEEALRKQAQEEIHILNTLVAEAPVGLVMLDRKLRQIQASQRWLDDTGMKREEVIGRFHYDSFPHLPDHWKEAHRRGLAGEVLSGAEERFLSPDGAEHFVNWQIRPWGDSGDETGGIIIYSEDITQRKQSEEAARKSELEYRDLFDHMSEGLAYCRMLFEDGKPRDFVYLSVNCAFEALTGLQDVIGKRVTEVIPGIRETDPRLFELYGRVALTGVPESFEVFVEALAMWFSISVYSPGNGYFVAVFDVITKRKQAEETLRRSEALLRVITENTPDLIFLKDRAGRMMLANPASMRVIGKPSQEVIGRADREFFGDPSVGEAISEVDQNVMERGETLVFEETVPTPMGSRTFLSSKTPWRDENGQVIGLIGVSRDITERKRAEIEARRWQRAFEQAELGIALANPANETFEVVNRAFARQRGYTPEELAGRPIPSVFPPEVRPGLAAQIGAVDSPTGHCVFESVHQRKDGSRFPVQVDLTAVRDEAGQLVSRVAYVQDLTERRKVEQTLRESEERFRRLVETIPDVVVVYDRDRRIQYINAATTSITGLPPSAFLGKRDEEMFPPEVYEKFLPTLLEAYATRAVTESQTELPIPGVGLRSVKLTCVPLLDEAGEIREVVGITQDLTEFKRAENQVRQVNAELERRVRHRTAQLEAANEELVAFSYSVSHDLRAPLRGIDGWSLALVEDYGDQLDPRARGYLERVRSESQRMGNLIDDLLRLSRVTRSEMNHDFIDLSSAARRIADRQKEAKPHRSIDFSIEPDLTAYGDERLIEIALTNLLENAVKFTGNRDQSYIEFGKLASNGEPVFYVRDNGAGFDMDYASNLFGPFQRMHSAAEFPGTGIGLANVQHIIRRHGGRVWAEAKEGQGATFFFTLGSAK
jgi:PAS domain S-box-containing protein